MKIKRSQTLASPAGLAKLMYDPSTSAIDRKSVLQHLLREDSEESKEQIDLLLASAANAQEEAVLKDKIDEYATKLDELDAGPQRLARFVRLYPGANSTCRAFVRLADGSEAFPLVPDGDLALRLKTGDRVAIDAEAKTIVCPVGESEYTGELGVFERRVNGSLVEVSLPGNQACNVDIGHTLLLKIETGDVKPGARLVVCPSERIALDAVDPADELSHFMFLDRSGPPQCDVPREIGAPPPIIDEIADHVRAELLHPERRRRYALRRSMSVLLVGPSGTGKTLSLQASIRKVYEAMSEITGVPAEDLPPRVFRVRLAEILSKWLGESDQRLARLFEEARALFDKPWEGPDGTQHQLPVVIVIEELDGLSRRRGGDGDAVYDRILTTALQALDITHRDYADRLIVCLSTTNAADLVDAAMIRRAGGQIVRFERLTRREAFRAVLSKHLTRVPLRDGAESLRIVSEEIAGCFYAENAEDQEVVELTLVGGAMLKKRFRDFFTGAVVDLAVQSASRSACRIEESGTEAPGVEPIQVVEALREQVRGLAAQLSEGNARDFLDLPRETRVASVRRLPAASA